MENQYQKWVVGSLMAFSALIAFVLFSVSLKLTGFYDVEASVRNLDLWLRLGSLVFAGLLFFVLYKNERSFQFISEVISELSRVTWPTQKETTSATFVTIIMVLISGFILWMLDNLWTYLIQAVL